jgi:hypothetical protein
MGQAVAMRWSRKSFLWATSKCDASADNSPKSIYIICEGKICMKAARGQKQREKTLAWPAVINNFCPHIRSREEERVVTFIIPWACLDFLI